MNNRDIHVGYSSVVIEVVFFPVPAIVTDTRITAPIVDSAVKTDMISPISGVPDINPI
jgi:hypothetical protein